MRRSIFAMFITCMISAVASGQDSGPGPLASTTAAVYDTSVYQRLSVNQAKFIFSTNTEGTTDAAKSGSLEVTMGEKHLIGSWNAYDLGEYAIWYGRAEDDTQAILALGWSTPDVIIGRASITASPRQPLQSLLQWFGFRGRPAFLYGSAVPIEVPPPKTAPEPASA